MDKSLFAAHTYFLRSKGWFLKFILLSFFSLPVTCLLFFYFENKLTFTTTNDIFLIIISAFFAAIIAGYCSKLTQNLLHMRPDAKNILPQFDGYLVDYLFIGLKRFWYYVLVNIEKFFQFFSFKSIGTSSQGVDLVLEGYFCLDFNKVKLPDFSIVYKVVKSDLFLYYKIGFVNSFGPFAIVTFIIIASFFHKKINYLIFFLPFLTSIYCLVSAYFAAIAGRNLKEAL